MEQESCGKCGAVGERLKLIKCPICFKMVCETCQTSRSGRVFCGVQCAHFFFFGDEDD